MSSIQKWADKVDYLGKKSTFTKEMKKRGNERIKAGTDAGKRYIRFSRDSWQDGSVFKKLNEERRPHQTSSQGGLLNGPKGYIDTVSP